MPILLVLALWACCAIPSWPPSPLGLSTVQSGVITLLMIVGSWIAAFAVRWRVVSALQADPHVSSRVGRWYSRSRRWLFYANAALTGFAVLGVGWAWAVQQTLVVEREGRTVLAPFAEAAVPLPYFLILLGYWIIFFDVERLLYRASPIHQGRPFWSRLGFLTHHLRQTALFLFLPIGLIVCQKSFERFAPETVRTDEFRILSLGLFPVTVVLMPLMVKPLLGLKSMSAGPERDELEAVASRVDFRCADYLVWPTRGSIVNAMMLGLIPRARYVVFTDRLLDELPADERAAVLGHEIGHAKHAHIPYYLAFLFLSVTVLAALSTELEIAIRSAAQSNPEAWYAQLTDADAPWVAIPLLVLMGVYFFVVFGFLSRRCERQADIFGCRAVSCGDPMCDGHDEHTQFPPGSGWLCPTGVRTFARALERVGAVKGSLDDGLSGSRLSTLRRLGEWVQAWQHSPISARVRFLNSLLADPRREKRFQRQLFVLRCGLVLGLLAALGILGQMVGWDVIWDSV